MQQGRTQRSNTNSAGPLYGDCFFALPEQEPTEFERKRYQEALAEVEEDGGLVVRYPGMEQQPRRIRLVVPSSWEGPLFVDITREDKLPGLRKMAAERKAYCDRHGIDFPPPSGPTLPEKHYQLYLEYSRKEAQLRREEARRSRTLITGAFGGLEVHASEAESSKAGGRPQIGRTRGRTEIGGEEPKRESKRARKRKAHRSSGSKHRPQPPAGSAFATPQLETAPTAPPVIRPLDFDPGYSYDGGWYAPAPQPVYDGSYGGFTGGEGMTATGSWIPSNAHMPVVGPQPLWNVQPGPAIPYEEFPSVVPPRFPLLTRAFPQPTLQEGSEEEPSQLVVCPAPEVNSSGPEEDEEAIAEFNRAVEQTWQALESRV